MMTGSRRETGERKKGKNGTAKAMLCTCTAAVLAVTIIFGGSLHTKVDVKADTDGTSTRGAATAASSGAILASAVTDGIGIDSELTEKRSTYVRQFAMTDGSYTAISYAMPVNYKKNGRWKAVNTTLKKTGKDAYTTKSTALSIKAAKKLNQKSVIALKRGSYSLSWALKDKKLKAVPAKISNPVKKEATDVLNRNQVLYGKALKNTDISYDIFPEEIQEVITINKKQKAGKLSFQLDAENLTVKIKGKKIIFQTKRGKTKYTRLRTVLTDANGVSATNLKLSYNKKKGVLTLTPSKQWWNSRKRKFPMEIRTAYITNEYERNVKIGAAYAGASDSSYASDRSLLVQAGKCVAFARMDSLVQAGSGDDVQIRDAALHVTSEKALKLGAGRTFDIGVYQVREKWSAKKLTYNNRPAYETEASATLSIQKAGDYACDVTELVKAWYAGEENHGVALVADNTARAYQARLDRQPYFSIHYEVVGFEGAVELKEGQEFTRTVAAAGQENYYYFDAKPGIAYELYATGALDTHASVYDADKNRLDYSDNDGLENNFRFVSAHDGRRYLKVGTKGADTGSYTLILRKRFAVPEPEGTRGEDRYTISWEAVANAREYLITIYDAYGVAGTAVTDRTSYEYVFTNDTLNKTLAFTVTPRESDSLKGEASRQIYTTDAESAWNYGAAMNQRRTRHAAAVCDGKIYVLGGIGTASGSALKSMEAYNPKTGTWSMLGEYPGEASGICDMAMVTVKGRIYVLGGQTETGTAARASKEVYCYDPETLAWTKMAEMPEGRTDMVAAAHDGKIYVFARAGSTERVDVYDTAGDFWETPIVRAAASVNLQAQTIDGSILVLQEQGEQMAWAEYLPETGCYDNQGTACTLADAGLYLSGTAINGKIYMVGDRISNRVLCYDAYLDEWESLSARNLKKEHSALVSVGTTLYDIGGDMEGFGILDVLESYETATVQVTKQMAVEEGESYELQVSAGNCEEDTDYLVTIKTDPSTLAFVKTSSFMQQDEMEAGKDGIRLVRYAPGKGILVLRLRGRMEAGETSQSYQSVPVVGVKDGTTVVSMEVVRKESHKP